MNCSESQYPHSEIEKHSRIHRNVLVALLLFLAVWLLVAFAVASSQRRFDRAVWTSKQEPEGLDTPRSKMVEDVITNYLKPGMTRQQIYDLLGKPDNTTGSDRENNREGYALGFIGSYADPSVLILQFDLSGKLITSHVIET